MQKGHRVYSTLTIHSLYYITVRMGLSRVNLRIFLNALPCSRITHRKSYSISTAIRSHDCPRKYRRVSTSLQRQSIIRAISSFALSRNATSLSHFALTRSAYPSNTAIASERSPIFPPLTLSASYWIAFKCKISAFACSYSCSRSFNSRSASRTRQRYARTCFVSVNLYHLPPQEIS